MKKCLLVSLVVLLVTPSVVLSEMMGGGMSKGASASPSSRGEMKPQMSASGMMGPGKGLMGGCAMPGGMMGPEMMGSMMPSLMEGLMPGKTRGCMMMAEGMMKGQMDMAQMRKALGLSDEQAEKLRASLRPFQKEAILTLASMKVAELELTDLLAGEKVDFGKVEAKLKEIEGVRTKARLSRVKATVAVKGLLSKEQLDKLQGYVECAAPPVPTAPQKDDAPRGESEHHQHQ